MKLQKRILSLLLTLCMIVGMLPTVVLAASSGTCGDNLTWTLDDTGTLTISGNGPMKNYAYCNVPWYAYRNQIQSVIIGDGVTSIGNYAFQDCQSLINITIGTSVTSIGDYAFGGCSSLERIVIPNSVTSIGDYAFGGCYSLGRIVIPNSVTSIGDGTFFECEWLYDITIPDSVTSIGSCAFQYCYLLTSIMIPDSVTNIGDGAFSYCYNLEIVHYSGTKEQWNAITIGGAGEEDCLRNATIVYEVRCCEGYKYIVTDDKAIVMGSSQFVNGDITIPSTLGGYRVTGIGDYAFCFCEGLTGISIPDSVTSIGDCAFYYCSSLTSIVIPDSVTSIGNRAFMWCHDLASATIGKGVTSVDYRVFYDCETLTSITIPDGVISVGEEAFYLCDSLETVYYGGTEEEWNAVAIGSRNDPLLNATIYFGECEHCWQAATCTAPKTCATCGATEGEALGHSWQAATCTVPKTCSTCGATEGTTSGHTYVNGVCVCGKKNEIAAPRVRFNFATSSTPDGLKITVTDGQIKYLLTTGGYAVTAGASATNYNIKLDYSGDVATMYLKDAQLNNNKSGITVDGGYNEAGTGVINYAAPLNIVVESDSAITCTSNTTSALLLKVTGDVTITSEEITEEDGTTRLAELTLSSTLNNVNGGVLSTKGNLILDNANIHLTDDSSVYGTTNFINVNGGDLTVKGGKLFMDTLGTTYTIHSAILVKKDAANKGGNVIFTGGADVKIYAKPAPNVVDYQNKGRDFYDLLVADGTITFQESDVEIAVIAQHAAGPDNGGYNVFNKVPTLTYPKGYTAVGSVYVKNTGSYDHKWDGTTLTVSQLPAAPANYDSIAAADKVNLSYFKIVAVSHDHVYSSVVTDPTCTEQGYTTYTCTICGKDYKADYTDLAEHVYRVVVTDPTCTEQGYTTYTCTGCGISYKTDYTEENGHVYRLTVKDPTCTTDGVMTYKCVTCNYKYSILSDATGHSASEPVVENAVAVTCTTDGSYDTVTYCYKCNEELSRETTIIPATGHNYENDVCTRCDELIPVKYTVVNGEVTITGMDSTTGELVIPESIDGNPVTAIGVAAFNNRKELTSVVIPDSVTVIGTAAFYNCSALERVTVGNGVEIIGDRAFVGCKNLKSVTVGDSVTTVGGRAFYGCGNLTDVTLGKGVTTIGDFAFSGCESLKNMILPTGVKTLGRESFFGCSAMETINIPNTVTAIGGAAFQNCTALTAIDLPESLQTIGDWAFYNCDKLTSVVIPGSVAVVGTYLFGDCDSLTDVTLSAGVTTIGNQAFFSCNRLTNVFISARIQSIGAESFYNCSALVSVTIPDSVTKIGNDAFAFCKNLAEVTYLGTQQQWNAIKIGKNNTVLTPVF